MKTIHCLFLLGFAVLSTSPLLAETDIAREMNQLQDQHAKAVAAATEPLKRRYQTSLEQLLKRATQTNDLDTALKIREQLTALGAAPVLPAAKPRYTRETLPQLLTKSEWTWSTKAGPPDHSNNTRVTFTKDQFLMAGKPICSYKVIDSSTVQLDKKVLKFDADYTSFEVSDWSEGTSRYGHRVNCPPERFHLPKQTKRRLATPLCTESDFRRNETT